MITTALNYLKEAIVLRAIRWLHARLPIRYWSWIFAFLVLGIGWGHAIALQPPASYNGFVDLTLVFKLGVITGLGSLIAVVGMILTRALTQKIAHRGLWIELVGTILLAGGPLQYLAIQLGFLYAGDFDQRYAIAWFAFAMCCFMLVRFSIIIPALIESSKQARTSRRPR